MDHFFYLYTITNKEDFQSKTFMEREITANTLYVNDDFQYCMALEKEYHNRPFPYIKDGREPVSYFDMNSIEQAKLIRYFLDNDVYKFKHLDVEDEEVQNDFAYLLELRENKKIKDLQFQNRLEEMLEFLPIRQFAFRENRVHFSFYPNGILKVVRYPTHGTLSEAEAKEHAETFYNILINLLREEKEDVRFHAFDMKEKNKRKHELHRSHEVLSYLFSSVDETELQKQLGMDEKEYGHIKEDLEKHTNVYKDKYVYTK